MMVLDFLRFIAEVRNIPLDARQRRLKEICERCGLMTVLGKDISQLSKGYRQRVGLAQAMVHDPDLLILDEPTSGLDPNQIVEIRDLIKDLGREKTVILSTHILPEVQATCGRVIIVSDGQVVADDTPDALAQRGQGAVIGVVVKGKNGNSVDAKKIKDVFAGVPGIHSIGDRGSDDAGAFGFWLQTQGNEDPREQLFNTAVKNDLVLLDMHREAVSLEDTFRRLTRGEGGVHA
jgi:ABC-2 type transport system ATP-binding protein